MPTQFLPTGSELSWELEVDDAALGANPDGLMDHYMADVEALLESEVMTALNDHSMVPGDPDKALSRIERRERTIDGVYASLKLTVVGFPGIPSTVASFIMDGVFESLFMHLDSHIDEGSHTMVMEISSLGDLLGDVSTLDDFLSKFSGHRKS
jgi:hypothetical protein